MPGHTININYQHDIKLREKLLFIYKKQINAKKEEESLQ